MSKSQREGGSNDGPNAAREFGSTEEKVIAIQTPRVQPLREPTQIIGLAIDVSGSMETSIQNAVGGQLSRLDAIRDAFDTVLNETAELAHSLDGADDPSILFFAYAFGVRVPGIECADLFRLLSLKGELTPPTEAEVKEEYQMRYRDRLQL